MKNRKKNRSKLESILCYFFCPTGQLVIQHHGDGELPEGMHVVNEDGVQVPVSIAFAQHLEQANVEHHQQQEQHEMEQQDALQQQHTEHNDDHELEQHDSKQHINQQDVQGMSNLM